MPPESTDYYSDGHFGKIIDDFRRRLCSTIPRDFSFDGLGLQGHIYRQ